jgi:hypothetical protein
MRPLYYEIFFFRYPVAVNGFDYSMGFAYDEIFFRYPVLKEMLKLSSQTGRKSTLVSTPVGRCGKPPHRRLWAGIKFILVVHVFTHGTSQRRESRRLSHLVWLHQVLQLECATDPPAASY